VARNDHTLQGDKKLNRGGSAIIERVRRRFWNCLEDAGQERQPGRGGGSKDQSSLPASERPLREAGFY